MSATITIEAIFNTDLGVDHPQSIQFKTPERATMAEAEADAALFPKGAKFQAYGVRGLRTPGDGSSYGVLYYQARAYTWLATDGVNKGVNETGVKRTRSIFRAIAKHELATQMDTGARNSYATVEAFEAGLAAQAS